MPFRFLAPLAAAIFFSTAAMAFDDPTHGQAFFPWLWADQIQPTAREAVEGGSLAILLGTAGATVAARQYDFDVRVDYGDHRKMPAETESYGDFWGSGYPGAAIAIGLLFVDQKNGLKVGRTLLFTFASQFTIATIANRERPNNGGRSFPSGHTSHAFALAGSLGYAYGPWVAVPALAAAAFVGASRIAANAHWFSDTVGGAGLGLFWAYAANRADLKKMGEAETASWSPVLVPGGMTMNFSRNF